MKKLLKKLVFFIVVLLVTFTVVVNISHAKKKPAFNIKIEKEISPYPPKLGDIIEVVFTVTSPYDLDDTHFMLCPLRNAQLISLEPNGFVAIEETDERYMKKRHIKKWLWFKIKANEKRQFRLKIRINDTIPNDVTNEVFLLDISVGVESWTEEHRSGVGSYTVELILVDREKGILGTRDELAKKLPVEYRYDAVDGTFYPHGSLDTPVNVKWNREIIQMMKELEPALSDSEALLLHSDHYKIGIPKGVSHWDEEKKRWTEEKIFEYYLNDGWFEALRSGKRDEWIKKERGKIKLQYEKKNKGGGGKPNFFVPGVILLFLILLILLGIRLSLLVGGDTKTISTTKTKDS